MAQSQIAARISGDDYQARFFWYQAAQLLYADSKTEKVILEHDEACHIDDVAVYFKSPGRVDGAFVSNADFFQVKYHVDQRLSYSANNMMDPTIIGSTAKSLLQRFFQAYLALKGSIPWFTLNLVSNWVWESNDNLAKSIRDSGALPDEFFVASNKSQLGKTRESWIAHLGTDADTFADFGQRLRLKLNFFGNHDFNTALSDRLFRAGLAPIDSGSLFSPYDDLARKFIVSGTTSFDSASLLSVCQRENLVHNPAAPRSVRTIGVRSFLPFAESMENETDAFVCVSENFDGRHARSDRSWINATISIKKFLDSQHGQLNKDHKILLDCHSSLAVLTGYLITSRAPAYPAGPRPKQDLQKPLLHAAASDKELWIQQLPSVHADAPNLAVVVSVTHQIVPDVLAFLNEQKFDVMNILELIPTTGIGPSSVRDADHALSLAMSLIQIIRSHKNNGKRTLMFLSAPNYLSYFIGQQLRAVGDVDLYEYDFDGSEPRTYRLSISLPLSNNNS
jgi:hypothetical protein